VSPLPERSDYKYSVGKAFTATRGKDTYQLRLVRISDVTGAIAKQRELSFMLIFDVGGASPMPDGIYTVRRFGVRTHALFMSGIGSPRSMQALMNRSV